MIIKKLPDAVISRIAAGEVITSPYNMIKELLENSLDAHATSIVISIDSTLQHVSIRDNGHGIEKNDLAYLCMNHYTSKTQSTEDLHTRGSIASGNSFGFRGEALYSISQCSHVTVNTRTTSDGDGIGHMAIYKNECLVNIKECAFDGCGTLIEIKDVFYNNQIRAEHYKKNRNELLNCISLVGNYGIIHMGIECRVDGKVVIGKSNGERLMNWMKPECSEILERREKYILERILNDKGVSVPNNLLSFTRNFGDADAQDNFQIICTTPNTVLKSTYFVLFVNRRLVKNDLLRNKILQKYRSIKKECNPFVFIELSVDDVDVNVHPSKTEVLVGQESIFLRVLEAFDIIFSGSTEIQSTGCGASNDSIELSKISSTSEPTDHQFTHSYSSLANEMPNHKISRPNYMKIYSSPFVRQLNENVLNSQQISDKSTSSSQGILLAELKDRSPQFLRSLVFVGVSGKNIYVQHQSNLLRIDKPAFLFNVFYQKNLRESGDFECVELKEPVETQVVEDLWEQLREYFGIHIEDGRIIALPKIYGLDPHVNCGHISGEEMTISDRFKDFTVQKTDDITTTRSIATEIAKIYSEVDINSALFNLIKTETIATIEVINTISLITGLRDLYRTFDRC